MLVAASSSNHHFIIGVRPRAVTTPVRLYSLSGTWGKMSTRREDPSPTPTPAPTSTSTRTACRLGAAKKIHWLSTVRVPGSRANLTAGPWPPKAQLSCSRDVSPAPKSLSGLTETPRLPRHVAPSPLTPVVQPLPPAPAPPGLLPARPESPLAHARRGAGPNVPPARIESSDTAHMLSIALPRPGGAPLAPEMITVSARRGGRLAVVADAWHLEHDCHYEWHVALPPREVDLGAVRARFGEDGTLVIEVPRRQARSGTRFV